MISSIYGKDPHDWLPSPPKGTPKGRLWEEIFKLSTSFMRFLSFKVRNGQRIKFWKDTWLGSLPLEIHFPNLYRISTKKDSTVAKCWNSEQNDWSLGFKRGIMERELNSWMRLEMLNSFRWGLGEDKVEWTLGGEKPFTTNSTFLKPTEVTPL